MARLASKIVVCLSACLATISSCGQPHPSTPREYQYSTFPELQLTFKENAELYNEWAEKHGGFFASPYGLSFFEIDLDSAFSAIPGIKSKHYVLEGKDFCFQYGKQCDAKSEKHYIRPTAITACGTFVFQAEETDGRVSEIELSFQASFFKKVSMTADPQLVWLDSVSQTEPIVSTIEEQYRFSNLLDQGTAMDFGRFLQKNGSTDALCLCEQSTNQILLEITRVNLALLEESFVEKVISNYDSMFESFLGNVQNSATSFFSEENRK